MTTKNGIDVEKMEQLTEAVEADADNGIFTFRAETEWSGGTTCETTVGDVEKGGRPVDGPEFTIEGTMLGSREAPTAMEQFLSALGTCLTVTYAAHGAKMGIDIDDLRFEFEGEVDMRGLLGVSDDVRPGYDEIACTVHVDADATEAELAELKEVAEANSPIVDNFTNAASLSTELRPADA